MRRRLLGAGAFLVGAALGVIGIGALSSNTHDRGVEAAMTGIFVFGPAAGVAGAVLGAIRGGRPGAGSGDSERPTRR